MALVRCSKQSKKKLPFLLPLLCYFRQTNPYEILEFLFCFLRSSACPPPPQPTLGTICSVVVELGVVASQIIDEVEPAEEDVVDGEANSGVDDDDDDELLVPKSPTPVQDEFCSFDDTDDNTDFEDVDGGAGGAGGDLGSGMKKVFASVLDVDDVGSQEEEEGDDDDDDDDQPPSLPPTLPPVLIVIDDADVAASCPSPQPSIISRPVSTTGVVLHSLVYAPRPYSAPKNINPS